MKKFLPVFRLFRRRRLAFVLGPLVVGLATLLWIQRGNRGADDEVEEPVTRVTPASAAQIQQLCSHCHMRPDSNVLPQSSWDRTVWMMSHFGGFGANLPGRVDVEAVAQWYRERAPQELELPPVTTSQGPGNLRLARHGIPSPPDSAPPFVSNIRLANVMGDAQPELIVCEMRNGRLLMGWPGEPDWALRSIAEVPYPAHVEAVDLDGDGFQDLIVANLGSFMAMDHKLGTVEWLRQKSDGGFERITLADNLGRVADVQAADMDEDGDLDLVVAEFGWRWTGHLLLLENQTSAGGPLAFAQRAIDGLHGNSHVALEDLDRDGRRDILALYSQEHEMVRFYRNLGKRLFDAHDLHRAPHPAWGSSGFQVIDLDGDGDLDVLWTNGDTYDDSLLKPYHGIQWLENCGSLQFQVHDLVRMYGVYRAEAADLDGDGDRDIVACALAESDDITDRARGMTFESILWLEQTEPGKFVHWTLESATSHHPNLFLGDGDLDGDIDLFVGNGQMDDTNEPPEMPCLDYWENKLR